jgi:hypothetical protein
MTTPGLNGEPAVGSTACVATRVSISESVASDKCKPGGN